MTSKACYYAKNDRQNLETTAPYQIPSKLEQLPPSQSTESLQSASIVRKATSRTSTVGSWKYPSKTVASLAQRAKNVYEPDLELSSWSYLPVHKTHRRIAELGANNETYKYTIEWLKRLRKIVTDKQMWWDEPLVNLGIDSEIVFEWWHETKKLTVYILGNTAEYIKVWGSDIDNEMEDGTASSPAELKTLWKWLIS